MIGDARAIWDAAVKVVDPFALVRDAACLEALADEPRILVVGAGKAGAAMAAGLEARFGAKLVGLVNVPDGATNITHHIRLHAARPAGSNHPTQAGVDGAEAMLGLLASANADDVAVCLLSGGGSALLPAP